MAISFRFPDQFSIDWIRSRANEAGLRKNRPTTSNSQSNNDRELRSRVSDERRNPKCDCSSSLGKPWILDTDRTLTFCLIQAHARRAPLGFDQGILLRGDWRMAWPSCPAISGPARDIGIPGERYKTANNHMALWQMTAQRLAYNLVYLGTAIRCPISVVVTKTGIGHTGTRRRTR
jgi:hypothetical protein